MAYGIADKHYRYWGYIMSHAIDNRGVMETPARSSTAAMHPAYQAYLVLYCGYIVLPIVAGVDKFFHVLVNWDSYLAPVVTDVLKINAHTFMSGVGIVEMAAGVLVLLKPQIGAYVVMLWLWGIVINLLLVPGFYDIALRDFGLSLGALALARLAREFGDVLRLGERKG
jgi:hypothetical protein